MTDRLEQIITKYKYVRTYAYIFIYTETKHFNLSVGLSADMHIYIFAFPCTDALLHADVCACKHIHIHTCVLSYLFLPFSHFVFLKFFVESF